MENTKERDRELYAAYRRFLGEANVNHAKAVALAVKSPASRYWVSPNYLYREIMKREKAERCMKCRQVSKRKYGKVGNTSLCSPTACRCRSEPEDGKAGKTRAMRKSILYDRLYADYLSLRLKPTCRKLSILTLCDLLVNRPAPAFFISEKRAEEIINRQRTLKKDVIC